MRRNNLSSSFLFVGQRLIVPASVAVVITPIPVESLSTPTATPIPLVEEETEDPVEEEQPVPARVPVEEPTVEVLATPTEASTK